MPSKIIQICPKCFSTRLYIDMKAKMYKDKQGFIQTPSLWGEIYHCVDCKFTGENIIEGNHKLLELLLENKKLKKEKMKTEKPKIEPKKEVIEAKIPEEKFI